MRDLVSKLLGYGTRIISAVHDYLVNFQCASAVMAGVESKFFKQASVINLQHDKSRIRIGNNSQIRGELLVFPYGGEIQIGDATYIGEGCRIWSGEKIIIGNHVGIAHNVTIVDCAHETDHLQRAAGVERIFAEGHPKEKGNIPTAPIIIEDYVAVYPNSCISRGVRIGEGSVISAGSVVLSDVPPFTLMLGNPARPMKSLKK